MTLIALIAKTQLPYNGFSPSLASPGCCVFLSHWWIDTAESILAEVHLHKRGGGWLEGWEAIFRNSGGVQGTMGWCEKAQCVCVHVSLSCCVWCSAGRATEALESSRLISILSVFNVWIASNFYTQQTLNSKRRACERHYGRHRWICQRVDTNFMFQCRSTAITSGYSIVVLVSVAFKEMIIKLLKQCVIVAHTEKGFRCDSHLVLVHFIFTVR